MKAILFSVLAIAIIGVMVPSAFGEIFIHEPTPQFSIQHPNGWIVQEFPEYRAVSIDADLTNRNGVSITLVCSHLYNENCGSPQADYQEMNFLKQDSKAGCEFSNYQDNYMICYNQKHIEQYIHNVDGFRAFSLLTEETWHQDGKDPYFPDSGGAHKILALETYILVANDVWLVYIVNDFNNFSMEQAEKILSTFKIKHIYDQEDIFTPPTWYEQLIDAIMSLFGGGNDKSPTTKSMISEPITEEYIPEQDYQWDNPIIIDDLDF